MELFNDDVSVSQIKKLKRRIVSWIWDSTPRQAIRIALICGIKIPKKLLDKYASQDQD